MWGRLMFAHESRCLVESWIWNEIIAYCLCRRVLTCICYSRDNKNVPTFIKRRQYAVNLSSVAIRISVQRWAEIFSLLLRSTPSSKAGQRRRTKAGRHSLSLAWQVYYPVSITGVYNFGFCDDFGIWLETINLVPDENQSATYFLTILKNSHPLRISFLSLYKLYANVQGSR